MTDKVLKKQNLRNYEYYDIQNTFDNLYNLSKNKNDYKFYNIMELILDEHNIELAYRCIKKNAGSNTAGTNNTTINDIKQSVESDVVKYVRNRLQNFSPHPIRRVEIPKTDGKTRPLGIPTIEDRLIQQCIKQILEPICEAKFYNHSYGFRPNRNTQHAIARASSLANKNKLCYVVDIDIKGFFDNVNHSKLLKQIWTLGIRDKRLICIIGKMLKAPINDIGIPNKGVPQGGILSPLLSNIVLNELDWWISGQWENLKTNHDYGIIDKRNNKTINSHKYRALRKSKLKEMYIVRYADDFKIFCRSYNDAKRIFYATKQWLKERLNLDISEEKSRIVNLNKNYSQFLGFKLKLIDKENSKVIISHISNKACENIKKKLRTQIRQIQKNTTLKNINKLNTMILGMHNYYRYATRVSSDFRDIAFVINKNLNSRMETRLSRDGTKSKCYEKYYGDYNFKSINIKGVTLFPIAGVKFKTPLNFTQEICNYTVEGRSIIHKTLQQIDMKILYYIMNNPIQDRSIEYNDNRISLYVGQNGKCALTGKTLEIGEMECHHKTPIMLGGSDDYSNLIWISSDTHKLIHATNTLTITKYICKLDLLNNDKLVDKINKLRTLIGNFEI